MASTLTSICTEPGGFHRSFHPEPINFEAQIIWMASLVALVIVSLLLRRSARYLANIGWFTLSGVILTMMVLPYFGL